MKNDTIKISNLCGCGGTIQDDVKEKLLIYKCVDEVIDDMSKLYDYGDKINKLMFFSLCLKRVMVASKGSMNPMRISNELVKIIGE